MPVATSSQIVDTPVEVSATLGGAAFARNGPPSLNDGDRLTRTEFERRYDARPDVRKAELIEGVVRMPSPVYLVHSGPHATAVGWLLAYRSATPGVFLADNQSVRLDLDNEVQPDAMLWWTPSGEDRRSRSGKYFEGAPDLVVEIAASSAAYDLHAKMRVYRRSGVPEYLVFLIHEQETRWFTLVDGVYESIVADDSGILQSRRFPGLWLDSGCFWSDDPARLLAVLQEGLHSLEHAAFVSDRRTPTPDR